MGWLGRKLDDLMRTIAGEPPVAFSYVPSIPTHEVPDTGHSLDPDECYISLYLESLRLERARRFGTIFNGLVYSIVSLVWGGEKGILLSHVFRNIVKTPERKYAVRADMLREGDAAGQRALATIIQRLCCSGQCLRGYRRGRRRVPPRSYEFSRAASLFGEAIDKVPPTLKKRVAGENYFDRPEATAR